VSEQELDDPRGWVWVVNNNHTPAAAAGIRRQQVLLSVGIRMMQVLRIAVEVLRSIVVSVPVLHIHT